MLCLGCLDASKSMKDVIKNVHISQYLLETMDIRVCDRENPWRYLCYECEALLVKFVGFKKRVQRLFTIIEDHIQTGESIVNIRNIKSELQCAEYKVKREIPENIECNAELHSAGEENIMLFLNEDNIKLLNENNMEVHIDFGENYAELANGVNLEHCNGNSLEVHWNSNKSNNATSNEENVNSSNKTNMDVQSVSDEMELKTKINHIKKIRKKRRMKQTITKQPLMRFVLTTPENINIEEQEKMQDMQTTSDTKKKPYSQPKLDPSKINTIFLSVEEQYKLLEERLNSERFICLPYGCNLCGGSYKNKTKLDEHMVSHDKKSGDFECPICHICFSKRHLFTRHEKWHGVLYQCLSCEHNTNCKYNIQNHYNWVHEKLAEYKCQHCPKVYKRPDNFAEHVKMHLTEREMKCETCGHLYHNATLFRKHQLKHIQSKSFGSDQSDKKVSRPSSVQANVATPANNIQLTCAPCNLTFKNVSTYNTHMRSSSKHVDPEQLRYKCSKCPLRFDTPSLLVKHELTKHAGKRYPCSRCERTFVVPSSLNHHIKRFHEGVQMELKHMCDTCGKAFTTKSILSSHIRTHTGERPFVCELCNRAFRQRAALSAHHKLVHLKIKTAQSYQRKKKKEI